MNPRSTLDDLVERADRLLDRIDALLPAPPAAPDWSGARAFRWRGGRAGGYLEAVRRVAPIRLDDLLGIERQKDELQRNTRQFVAGRCANNALLWGSRGTGKSSLVKALLNAFHADGLRVVELDPYEMTDLPRVFDLLAPRPERFVLFCDDLSFEPGDTGYKALKATLDGSLLAVPDNVLVYATSNRRHLVPETMEENREARVVGTELHQADAMEEKISLSERFGLWLSFYPFDQATYLRVVRAWLARLGAADPDDPAVDTAAVRWATAHGSRSGRAAWQFAKDWVGRMGT